MMPTQRVDLSGWPSPFIDGWEKANIIALMWLNLAAAQGQGETVRNLLTQTMPAEQVAESQRRAEAFKGRAPGVKATP